METVKINGNTYKLMESNSLDVCIKCILVSICQQGDICFKHNIPLNKYLVRVEPQEVTPELCHTIVMEYKQLMKEPDCPMGSVKIFEKLARRVNATKE